MNSNTFELLKKILNIVVLVLLVAIFSTLLILTKDDKFVRSIKQFIKTDTKVLYISNSKNYNEYPVKLLDKYEIEYKYIDSGKLSKFEKNKIQKIVNNKDLSNIIVIFESGKIKDALLSYENNDKLEEFLTKNEVIPSIRENISGLVNKIIKAKESDSLILYLPYVYDESMDYQDNLLKDISKRYGINYKRMDAYLLSNTQKQKINLSLGLSDVEDQIVLFIKDKEIVDSLRGYNRKSKYINKLFENNYIENITNSLNEIGYDEFSDKIGSNEKNVILITKDDCKYCNEVINILNQISSSNNLDIDYINIGAMDSEIAKEVEEDLKKLKYKDGFSTPLTIITEKGKILDYSIGLSSADFFKEMFTEYGLLK